MTRSLAGGTQAQAQDEREREGVDEMMRGLESSNGVCSNAAERERRGECKRQEARERERETRK